MTQLQIDREKFDPRLALLNFHLSVKLGKHAARPDKRTLRFSKYAKKLDAPPASVDWTGKVPSWPMLANDQLGDCTCAGAGHMVECWLANVGVQFTPTDAQTIAMYEAVGGYVPGNESTDNGANELDVLNYWRQTGFANHKIAAFAAVNPQNETEVKQAINLFGGVYIGLAMPLAWQGSEVWDAPASGLLARLYRAAFGDSDWTPGSWGGHAVPVLSYDETEYTPITWGSAAYRITKAGFSTFCDECYAIVTQDFIAANGHDPQGFDVNALLADLKQVSA